MSVSVGNERIIDIKPMVAGKEILWGRSQWEFLTTDAEWRCLFGSFGAGKSTALYWLGITKSVIAPGGAAFVGTDTGPNVERQVMKNFKDLLPRELIIKENLAKRRLLTRTSDPDRPFTWHFQPYLEWEKLGGDNLTMVLGDEMSRCQVESHRALTARLRHPSTPWHLLAYATNNRGHDWLWRVFVKDNENRRNLNRWWKTLTTYENLQNLPPNYLDQFRDYPQKWWDRYIEGKFVDFEGQVYEMLNAKEHRIDIKDLKDSVKRRGEDMRQWRFSYSLDHGFEHPTICIVWAEDCSGNLIALNEYYQRALSPLENARNIVEFLKPYQEYGSEIFGYADPSMWSRHGGHAHPMQYYDEEFKKVGLRPPLPAFKNDNVSSSIKTRGVVKVQSLLTAHGGHRHVIMGESPAPKLYFCYGAKHAYEDMRVVTWDDRAAGGSEKVNKVNGDDGADAVWYRVWNLGQSPVARKVQRVSERQQFFESMKEISLGPLSMPHGFDPGVGVNDDYGVGVDGDITATYLR